MECNKDEAFRAKDLAEKKMQNRDFLGARRIALKAQRLFPGVENISQILTVCEVHCSAGVQVNGEMNWYGILQVEPTADDSSIKKQYRKLAVLLHPDKNQLSGAEEAFKLIVQAYTILSDQAKRDRYDMKINVDVKTAPQGEKSHQVGGTVNAKNGCTEATFNAMKVQKGHPPAFPPSQASLNTCSNCNMKYQKYSKILNESLPCRHCEAPFVACSLDSKTLFQNADPSNIRNNFGKHQEDILLNRVKVANQKNQFVKASNTCRKQSMNAEHRVGPTNVILDAKVGVKNEISKGEKIMESTISEVKQSMNAEHRVGHINVILDAKVDIKDEISKGPKFMESIISEVRQGQNSSEPSNAGQKRVRRLILEYSESDDAVTEDLAIDGDATPTKVFTPKSTPRRSRRLNKKVAYDEVGSEDDHSTTKLFTLASTPQRSSRLNKSIACNEVGDEYGNNDFDSPCTIKLSDSSDSPCIIKLSDSSVDVTTKLSDSSVNVDQQDKEFCHEVANKEEAVDNSTTMFRKRKKLAWLEDILQDGRKRMKRCKRWSRMKKKKPRTTPQCSSNNLTEVRKLCYPDPEFWDFNKSRSASQFAVDQIWATYDNKDGMPRFYARIRQVYGPNFKVRFTWLERNPGNESEIAWSDKDLPVACGNYSLGTSDIGEDQLMFSHLVTWKKGKKRFSYDIYPKVGEVWALFKDWSIGWSSDAGNHKNYKYEVVEVISEFAMKTGIRVIPLVKIEGFVSLFMRAEGKQGAPVLIPPSEILRFSHHIPAYRLPKTEREGIPANSMELDCASLPANFKVLTSTSLARRTDNHNVDKLGGHSSSHFRVTVNDKKSEDSVRVQQKQQKNKKADFGVDNDAERVSPLSPIMFDYPDPEFHNFDKLRSFGNFYRGQIWALYSDIDKYPKYYGWIKKVDVENGRLHVAWLEACPVHEEEIRWIAEEMPISCGAFKFTRQIMVFGRSEFFSHIVHTKHTGRKGQCVILPHCSEVWAIYKNWKVGWRRSDLQNCEYDIVEICKVDDSSIKVLLLTRAAGYRTVFKPERTGNVPATLEIQADEYIRFSHQIPASRITDESRWGKLEGYWELDTAALPDHLLSLKID